MYLFHFYLQKLNDENDEKNLDGCLSGRYKFCECSK